jgi:hypothetical protein
VLFLFTNLLFSLILLPLSPFFSFLLIVLVAGVSARDLAAEFKDFDSLMNGSSIRSAVVDDSAYDKNKDEEVEEEEVEDSNETSLLIEQNFEDRGLKPPHFMCADAATLPDAALPLLREAAVTAGSGVGGEEEEEGLEVGRFDAIVTDPPYGKREWLGETKQHQVRRKQWFHSGNHKDVIRS